MHASALGSRAGITHGPYRNRLSNSREFASPPAGGGEKGSQARPGRLGEVSRPRQVRSSPSGVTRRTVPREARPARDASRRAAPRRPRGPRAPARGVDQIARWVKQTRACDHMAMCIERLLAISVPTQSNNAASMTTPHADTVGMSSEGRAGQSGMAMKLASLRGLASPVLFSSSQ